MYKHLDLKYNPTGKSDIDERREEMMSELAAEIGLTEEDEESSSVPEDSSSGSSPCFRKLSSSSLQAARRLKTSAAK